MRYALIDTQRREAEPGLAGICPGCGQAMIAKCGPQRVHHWAHKGARACDPWWEPETAWHRGWKQQFDTDWQEFFLVADTGERHIADVRTSHGLVLEFQHSHIPPAERRSREAFYRNMTWIVDGTRLKRDLPRFSEVSRSLAMTQWRDVYTTPYPEECFPRGWLDSAAPVFFDFAGTEPIAPGIDIVRRCLWGLLPGRADRRAVIVAIDRQRLVLAARTRPAIVPARQIVGALDARFRADRVRATVEARRYAARSNWRPRTPKRRTPRF